MITSTDLQYQGAFRLPREESNGESFSFGGKPLAFSSNSLFVGGRGTRGNSVIAQVSIPNEITLDTLPFSEYLQGFVDPTEGKMLEGAALSGALVVNNKLWLTPSIYYDANNTQRVSHGYRSLDLSNKSFYGWISVWNPEKSGYVSGYMATVPSEWQERLKGSIITGQFGIPIATRTSWGPSAFTFNPMEDQAFIPAIPLVYYDGLHPTLGQWEANNEMFGIATAAGGMFIVDDSLLFIGTHGIGKICYGPGTTDKALIGTRVLDAGGIPVGNEYYCEDPTNSDKGQHAYPYQFQVWAYYLDELAEAANGIVPPWSILPYNVWKLEVPTIPTLQPLCGGITYDSITRTIYLSQMKADIDGYSNRALIHSWKIRDIIYPIPVPVPIPIPPDTLNDEIRRIDLFAASISIIHPEFSPAECYNTAQKMLIESRKR